MINKKTIFGAMSIAGSVLLTACSQQPSLDWYESVDGNHLRVVSYKYSEDNEISVSNTVRTWNGKYQGGEEKIPMRKELLLQVADKESKKICGQEKLHRGSPSYVMKDHQNAVSSQGLFGVVIGEAMSHVMSRDENLPTSMSYRFVCGVSGEEKSEDLEE